MRERNNGCVFFVFVRSPLLRLPFFFLSEQFTLFFPPHRFSYFSCLSEASIKFSLHKKRSRANFVKGEERKYEKKGVILLSFVFFALLLFSLFLPLALSFYSFFISSLSKPDDLGVSLGLVEAGGCICFVVFDGRKGTRKRKGERFLFHLLILSSSPLRKSFFSFVVLFNDQRRTHRPRRAVPPSTRAGGPGRRRRSARRSFICFFWGEVEGGRKKKKDRMIFFSLLSLLIAQSTTKASDSFSLFSPLSTGLRSAPFAARKQPQKSFHCF